MRHPLSQPASERLMVRNKRPSYLVIQTPDCRGWGLFLAFGVFEGIVCRLLFLTQWNTTTTPPLCNARKPQMKLVVGAAG